MNLKELRKKRGLTQEQCAEQLYMSTGKYSKIEAGEKVTRADAEHLSSYFGIDKEKFPLKIQNCTICQKGLTKRSRGLPFCSRKCRMSHKGVPPRVCALCGKPVEGLTKQQSDIYKNTYCDRDCYSQSQQKGRSLEYVCAYCGKRGKRVASAMRAINKYCSRQCYFSARYEKGKINV